MKALIQQIFAHYPLHSFKPMAISTGKFLKIAWLQKKKKPSRQLADDPRYWDVDWFNNYE